MILRLLLLQYRSIGPKTEKEREPRPRFFEGDDCTDYGYMAINSSSNKSSFFDLPVKFLHGTPDLDLGAVEEGGFAANLQLDGLVLRVLLLVVLPRVGFDDGT